MSDDDLLDAFDRAWRDAPADAPPMPEDFLPEDSDSGRLKDHLERLIAIDLEYRWKQYLHRTGASPSTAGLLKSDEPALRDYADRFPVILQGRSFSEELEADARNAAEIARETAAPRFPVIPGFRILSVLGRGGKGVVYKAEQTSLNRLVAIKTILTPHTASSLDVARLQNEARALGRLQHPNLVMAYALECHDSIWYLILEYVDGADLAAHLRDHVLTGRQAAEYLIAAARGVQCAHKAQILHRDLKPSNILLDARGTVRVTDFGLSRLMNDEGRQLNLTATADVLGTPGYIAPEQARGHASELKPATDVYGLGATLYHMLTGRPPFVGPTVLDVLQQVEQEDVVPPQQLQPSVPSALQTICLKCLEKNSQRRYASAELLVEDLQRYLDGVPISAKPVSRTEKISRWCHRNPLAASLAAVVCSMLVALVWLVVSSNLQQAEALVRADKQRAMLESTLKRERTANRNVYDSQLRQAFLEYRANRLKSARALLSPAEPVAGAEEWRRWEWYYLASLVDASERVLVVGTEDANWVTALAFSPDGRWLAAGAGLPEFMDRSRKTPADLKVWDTTTWQLHLDLEGQVFSMTSLVFSADGQELFAVERNNGFERPAADYYGPSRVRRWSMESRQELPAILSDTMIETLHDTPGRTHLIAVESGSAEPGRLLVVPRPTAENPDPRPTVWNNWSRRSDGPGFVVSESALPSEAGRGAIVLETDGVTHVPPRTAYYHPTVWCGHRLRAEINTGRHDVLSCFDSCSQQLVHMIHGPPIEHVALSPSERLLAIATNLGEIRLWDTEQWRERLTLRGHESRIRSLTFNRQESQLVSGDWEGNVRVWNLLRPREFHDVLSPNPGADLTAFAYRPDGQLIAMIAGEPLHWIQTESGAIRTTATIPFALSSPAPGRKAAFDPPGRLLYVVSLEEPCRIDVWDVNGSRILRGLAEHSAPVMHLFVDRDCVASAAWQPAAVTERWDKSAQLIVRRTDGAIAFQTAESGVRYYRVVVSPDQKWVAASVQQYNRDGILRDFVRAWELASGQVIDEFPMRSWVLGLQFSEFGRQLVATDFEHGDLCLRDPARRETIVEYRDLVPQMQDLRFLDRDRRLAAVSRFDFRLLDLSTGHEVLKQDLITFNSDYIFNPQVILSPDGRQILMNQADGTVRIIGQRAGGSLQSH